MNKTLTLVAAMGRNRVIGRDGSMPWHLPAELQHFKATTLGKPVLMGRKTWESIGRPLPGRQNIVITRDRDYRAEGCEVVHSLEEAISKADGSELMLIGGGQLYAQALPLASRLVLTLIDIEPDGDTWFPDWDEGTWECVERREVPGDDKNPIAFTVTDWLRRVRED